MVQDFADNVPLVLPKKKKAAEPEIESKKAAEPEIVPLQEGHEAAGSQVDVAPQIVPMVEDHMEVDRSHESIALPSVASSSMEHRPLLPTTMEVAASKPNQMQQGNAARGESVLSLPVHVGAQHGPRMVPQKVSVIAGHPADNDMSFMKCEKCGRKEMFPLARVVAWGDAVWECQLAGLRCFSVRQRRAPQ